MHRQYKSKSAGEWHKVKASREEEQRYSKQNGERGEQGETAFVVQGAH